MTFGRRNAVGPPWSHQFRTLEGSNSIPCQLASWRMLDLVGLSVPQLNSPTNSCQVGIEIEDFTCMKKMWTTIFFLNSAERAQLIPIWDCYSGNVSRAWQYGIVLDTLHSNQDSRHSLVFGTLFESLPERLRCAGACFKYCKYSTVLGLPCGSFFCG